MRTKGIIVPAYNARVPHKGLTEEQLLLRASYRNFPPHNIYLRSRRERCREFTIQQTDCDAYMALQDGVAFSTGNAYIKC
jgi:hypothetical protein